MQNDLKYFIYTFGCQMNMSDSERIAALLEKIGYQPAQNEQEADLIVANMCSVRQSAVDRVIGLGKVIPELKAKNPNLKTVLTGCVLIDDFKKSDKLFDYILPIKNLAQWPELLKEEQVRQPIDRSDTDCSYLKMESKYANNFSVFIPISNGCNNFCTYCAVPYTRGEMVCRDYRDILDEIKKTIKNGAKEVWLLGQNVNDYNCDRINFAKLLEMINDLPGDFWIRFTSPHPKDFSDGMISAIARCQKVSPYISLPIQSGDNEVLKRMNRPYTVNGYRTLVQKIRKAFQSQRRGMEREVALATDIIVGYPGETKNQFEETSKMMDVVKFDMAYIAQYSPRPGTVSARIPDNVSKKEKDERWQHLTEILKRSALARNKIFIDQIIDVLINEQRGTLIIGKSRHFKTVKINISKELAEKNFVGQFVKVKVNSAMPWGLGGALTE